MRVFVSRAAVALSVVFLMFAASQARAASMSVLAEPPGAECCNIWPGNTGGVTWQTVYDSSFFGAFALEIASFGFKGGNGFNGPISYPDFVVRMSTTSVAPGGMSDIFANNVGADETTVMSGPLSFSSSNGEFTDFMLDTAFKYDPTIGNLLIHIEHAAALGGDPVGFLAYDEPVAGLQRVAIDSFGADSGTDFGMGELATRFDGVSSDIQPSVVPLPAALPLIGSGLAILGFAGWRRKRQAA